MFVSIQKYKIKNGSAFDIVEMAKTSFYPIISQLNGFKDFYVLDLVDTLVSVSIFDNQPTGIDATNLAVTWMIENAKQYIDGKSEAMSGIPIFSHRIE